MVSHEPDHELRAVEELRAAHDSIVEQLGRVVVGLKDVIDQLIMACFAGGHCLLVGPSGLAKTLVVNALADTLDLSFRRIQFTPDLMPSDITGDEVIEEDRSTGKRSFRFIPGPVFANIVLADEINRTPPKTQAALLEAMTELKVTSRGKDHSLDAPFLVFATQNASGTEGTYPLPEAQLDRFLLSIDVGYPTLAEEIEIIQGDAHSPDTRVEPVVHRIDLLRFQKLIRRVPVSTELVTFAAKLIQATRPESGSAPDFVRDYVAWGAGPRASVAVIRAAKAKSLLSGRTHVDADDIRYAMPSVLRHRLVLNFNAEAEGIRPDEITTRLLDLVPNGIEP